MERSKPHSRERLCRRWSAFGTTVELRLWPRPGRAAAAALRLAQSVAFLRRGERQFSRFQPESELSRLNLQAGAPVRVSPALFRLTAAALAAARATDGLFDPTVQRALLAAGYTRSFPLLGDQPTDDGDLETQPGRYAEVVLDAAERTVTLPPGVGLDLGGIAKGWLADAVARRLRPFGVGAVNLGGDCRLTEPGHGAPPWLIEVADPWTDRRVLAEIALNHGGGVATSGILRRRWRTSRGWQHHLIDPRHGRPATTDLASVTILGPSAAASEVIAKVVLLLGHARGLRALARKPGFAGLLVPLDAPPIWVPASSGCAASLLEVTS